MLTAQPGSHWHCPVTGWQVPWFWHWHEDVQLVPWVPTGHGWSQRAPIQPGWHVHEPDSVSQLTPFSHLQLSLQSSPYWPSGQGFSQ